MCKECMCMAICSGVCMPVCVHMGLSAHLCAVWIRVQAYVHECVCV